LIGGSFAGALQGGEKMGPYTIQIEDPTHPITRGVQEFQLPDEERYIQMTLKEDIHLLFSSDRIAQKNFGWTRTEGAGRVFFFQPCHFLPTWETPGLGQILVNGVRWAGTQTRGSP
jgi:type 1 glutamine amidotransferase